MHRWNWKQPNLHIGLFWSEASRDKQHTKGNSTCKSTYFFANTFICLCAGIIKLRRSPPPRLRGPQYVLNITATDDNASGGPYPLSSSAQVIVGINDINNNKPVFEEVTVSSNKNTYTAWSSGVSSYLWLWCLCSQCQNYSLNAAVLENQPPGTFVLRVQAHDADMGVNGEVKYGIMHRDGVSSGFDIDPDTGKPHSYA